MAPKQPKTPFDKKSAKTERQQRLSAALRENLRKRKSQSQERQKPNGPAKTESQV